MQIKNELSHRIDTAGDTAKYDNACKCLLADKQVLARILKYCVQEFSESSIKDIEEKYIEGVPQISEVSVHPNSIGEFIEGMNTEDSSISEGTVYYDIRFRVISPEDGGVIRMIINVEAQNDFYPGYPIVKRGIYYGSRLISAQYETVFDESHYEKIEKVYSIWVCPDPPIYRRNSITGYSIKEWNMIGEIRESETAYDLMTVIVICLGGESDKNYGGIIKMLDVLLSEHVSPEEKKKVLQEEFDISMTKEMESEAMVMCNLSQGIVDRTKVECLSNMMENTNMSIEECMKAIGIPTDRMEAYKLRVEEKMRPTPV